MARPHVEASGTRAHATREGASTRRTVSDPPQLEPPEPPLTTHALCRTSDLDVFRDRLCAMFYPARVDTLRGRAQLEGSWLAGLRLTHLTVGAVRFGAEAVVEPGRLGSYHVNVPLAGHVESVCGARRVVASPTCAAVFTPEPSTALPQWSADATQLCIKIPRRSLETEATLLLGHSLSSSVDFALRFDLTTGPARSWLATLRLLLTELERPESPIRTSPAHREHLERLVISGLILAQSNAHTAELALPQPRLRPRTVQRALTLIEEHPDHYLTVADLAGHAGVGARRLQQGFREHVGMSPTVYLRQTRLRRARRDLLHTEDTVTEIALRWCFTHPGRFARLYRDQFGETPSETRRG